MLFCIGVVIAGFDPQLIGTLIAVPAFRKDFGESIDGSYYIAASWQSWFNLAVPVGQVAGALLIEKPLHKFGRKKAIFGCSLFTVTIQVTARSKIQILLAEMVNGLVRGAYPVIATTFISEVTPVVLRGFNGTFVNIAFVVGQFCASAILAVAQGLPDRRAYVIPFASQFIFPVIVLCAVSLFQDCRPVMY